MMLFVILLVVRPSQRLRFCEHIEARSLYLLAVVPVNLRLQNAQCQHWSHCLETVELRLLCRPLQLC